MMVGFGLRSPALTSISPSVWSGSLALAVDHMMVGFGLRSPALTSISPSVWSGSLALAVDHARRRDEGGST